MKYGLIGERLSHSFSKEIHKRLYDYEYELKEIAPHEIADFMSRRDFMAINVTIPYKETVIPYLDCVDETARRIGAVNTIVNQNGALHGYNTDLLGLCALIRHCGADLTGKKVLILGSGGTSKTALAASQSLGSGQVVRVSRMAREDCITYEQAKEQHGDAAFIINTTPCGMYPHIGVSAVDLADYPLLEGAFDVVYNPLRPKLVCDAMARGIPAQGGLYMLVAQAVYAAGLFTGEPVDLNRIDTIYEELLHEKQNIVLVGMPGCGKTTVGTRLAQALSFDFADTDAHIVAEEKRTIPEIFASVGESGFRDLETAAIRSLATRQRTVIATGGGAVLRPENVHLLRENGRIYFLDRSLEKLVTADDRPLSSNRADLERRYQERYDIYTGCCDRHVDADSTVDEIVRWIREDLDHENSGD